MSVTTKQLEDTLVVEFNAGSSGIDHIAIAELDPVLNGDTTKFGPGDVVNVRLHLSNNIQFDEVRTTDGSVSSNGSDTRTMAEEVLFSGLKDLTEHTVSVVPSSTAIQFYNKTGSPSETADSATGAVTFTGKDLAAIPYLTKMTHNYNCLLFKVTLPNVTVTEDSDWPVAVVFYVSER